VQRKEHARAATRSRAEIPLIDKDTILERLFESKGVGDALWRHRLSRESDVLLEAEAKASAGAVLVSFWHLPGMPMDSGTPTAWLPELSTELVEVHCACQPEVAAQRFLQRRRHPGHLNRQASYAEVLRSLRAIPCLGALKIGPRVNVDTSQDPDLDIVIRDIHAEFLR
jgi:glucokinase